MVPQSLSSQGLGGSSSVLLKTPPQYAIFLYSLNRSSQEETSDGQKRTFRDRRCLLILLMNLLIQDGSEALTPSNGTVAEQDDTCDLGFAFHRQGK